MLRRKYSAESQELLYASFLIRCILCLLSRTMPTCVGYRPCTPVRASGRRVPRALDWGAPAALAGGLASRLATSGHSFSPASVPVPLRRAPRAGSGGLGWLGRLGPGWGRAGAGSGGLGRVRAGWGRFGPGLGRAGAGSPGPAVAHPAQAPHPPRDPRTPSTMRKFPWLIGASWSIAGIPVPVNHHEAQINHANGARGTGGTIRGAERPGTGRSHAHCRLDGRPAGRPGNGRVNALRSGDPGRAQRARARLAAPRGARQPGLATGGHNGPTRTKQARFAEGNPRMRRQLRPVPRWVTR
jgi:hypothetical protein